MDSLPYGPNTRAVRRFLQRFAALEHRQWETATTAFAALEHTRAFMAADRALAEAIEHAGLGAARDAVLGPLLQVTRGPNAEPGEAHPVAAPALGAVLALVARDVLDASQFAALYAPFATLVPADTL